MKKEILFHLLVFLLLFLVVAFTRGWIIFTTPGMFAILPFFIGGLIGTFMPDIDHYIYVKYLRPQELTSQRVEHLVANSNYKSAIELLYTTRAERTNLIFHTVLFQILFFTLTFLVVTSSGNLFGRGLTLAFCLHLLVDQYVDFKSLNSITHWFKNIPVSLTPKGERNYFYAGVATLLVFAFLF